MRHSYRTMLQYWLLLFWICTHLNRAAELVSDVCGLPKQRLPGPSLPDLPSQFETRIELNIVQKRESIELVEYYDYLKKIASVQLTWNKKTQKMIVNYGTKEIYNITKDACSISNLTSGFSNFGFMSAPSGSNIVSVSDIFKFGKKFNETFISEKEMIRGIAVNHWRSCIYISQLRANCTVDYYFSKSDYKAAWSTHSIPIRAKVSGTAQNVQSDDSSKVHRFLHYYEFMNFRQGPIQDVSVFETPRGVICAGRRYKQPPGMLQQLAVYGEIVDSAAQRLASFGMVLDFTAELIRIDEYISSKLHPEREQQDDSIQGPAQIILDFKKGLQYIMRYGSCMMKPHSQLESSLSSADSQHDGPLQIKDVYQLMRLNQKKLVYGGQRKVRNILVDVWSTEMHLIKDRMIIREFYFTKQVLSKLKSDVTKQYIPVGIYQRNINRITQVSSETWMDLYAYLPGKQTLVTFDVSKCYGLENQLQIEFKVDANYTKYVEGKLAEFITSVHTAVARAADVSLVRITNIRAGKTSAGKILVMLSVLGPPKLSGELKLKHQPVSLQKAFSNLKSKKSITFSVMYTKGTKNFHVTPGTLYRLENVEPYSLKNCHSKGSMAGLGIGMLVLGSILGLAIGYVIYKRFSNEIPYSITK